MADELLQPGGDTAPVDGDFDDCADAGEPPPQDWFFTFGSGHVHPATGESMGRRYVRFHGTHASARAQMVAAFGIKWSHQYPSAATAGADQYGLEEFHVKSGTRLEDLVPAALSDATDLHNYYLGDGVYASFDGLHIWLKSGTDHADEKIALAPSVFEALLQYQAALREPRKSEPPPAAPALGALIDEPSMVPARFLLELLRAALAWRAQGSLSRWTTPESVALARLVDKISASQPELCQAVRALPTEPEG